MALDPLEPWFVYIVRCCDNSLYVGVTKDIERRVKEHNTSKRGARYTSKRRPVVLVYHEPAVGMVNAMRREYKLKRWSKAKKECLIASQKNSSN